MRAGPLFGLGRCREGGQPGGQSTGGACGGAGRWRAAEAPVDATGGRPSGCRGSHALYGAPGGARGRRLEGGQLAPQSGGGDPVEPAGGGRRRESVGATGGRSFGYRGRHTRLGAPGGVCGRRLEGRQIARKVVVERPVEGPGFRRRAAHRVHGRCARAAHRLIERNISYPPCMAGRRLHLVAAGGAECTGPVAGGSCSPRRTIAQAHEHAHLTASRYPYMVDVSIVLCHRHFQAPKPAQSRGERPAKSAHAELAGRRVAGPPPALAALPTQRSRPAVSSMHVAIGSVQISREAGRCRAARPWRRSDPLGAPFVAQLCRRPTPASPAPPPRRPLETVARTQ